MNKLTEVSAKSGYRATCNHYRNLRYPLFLILLVLLLTSQVQANYSGGTGEPNNPYKISTHADMQAIGANPSDWNKHFKLVNDINLSSYTGTAYNIIGTGYFLDPYQEPPSWVGTPFSGTFDGNGYKILNFSYHSTDQYYIGIFGIVNGQDAEIRNLSRNAKTFKLPLS